MIKYLILNFSKKVGHTKTHSNATAKTIRGNLVLSVDDDFIDRFNVPIFVEDLAPLWERNNYSYVSRTGKDVTVPKIHMKAKLRKGKYLIEISKKTQNSDILSPSFLPQKYYLRFPDFFNSWMIDNALFQILQYAPDFELLRFSINEGKRKEITGESTGYGSVALSRRLISGDSPYHRQWGETCYIKPLSSCF